MVKKMPMTEVRGMDKALVIILVAYLVWLYVTHPRQRNLPDDDWELKSYTAGEGDDRYIYIVRGQKLGKKAAFADMVESGKNSTEDYKQKCRRSAGRLF